MRASTSYLRALQRVICLTAKESGKSLEDLLGEWLTSSLKPGVTGKVLTQSSVGGQSVSYQLPEGTDLGAQDISEALSFLMDMREAALCALPADPAPTDEEICAWVIKNLQRRGRELHDFAATTRR